LSWGRFKDIRTDWNWMYQISSLNISWHLFIR
jgi:hypothetical protein